MAKVQPKDDAEDKEGFVDELKPGTKLMHGQYTIESFLNAGGFGITYLARDSLDRKVVIKECFPGAFCRRSRYVVQPRSRAHQNELQSIVRLFVQEARSLAKLDHPNIVGVHQVFEDNDTAYMALDFVEGRDLLDTIEDPNHGLTPPQIKSILKDLLGAIGFIHDQGILHRDISPDNILINDHLHPVLIDFGAAREEATKQSRILSALRVVKDGYSPQEFYIAGSDQNPSSDLYALAASFYHLIVGDVPPNSQARLAAIASGETDSYVPLVGRFPEYDKDFLAAMDKALAVLPKDRVQSAKEWIALMEGTKGNVTPLKTAGTGTPSEKPPAQALPSKLPLLLGAAAVIALVVGLGVVMMSGGDATPPVADTTDVADTPVAPPETPADAVAPTEEGETATAADGDAVDDDIVPTEDTAATPDVPVQDSVAVAPETTDPEQADSVASSAIVLPDPDVNRTITMRDDATSEAPDTPVQASEAPETANPTVSGSGETEGAALTSDWRVQLPFTAAGPQSNIIAEVGSVAPVWVQPGLVITGVNGTEIDAISEINDVLHDQTDERDVAATLPVTFQTLNPVSGVEIDRDWLLPLVQEVTLGNGTRFETVFAGTDWQTTVVELSEGQEGGLQIGDVITSYIPTGEAVNGRDTLLDIFTRETGDGVDQFIFAVQRDEGLWVATLTYAGVAQ